MIHVLLFTAATLISGQAFAESIHARVHSVVQGEGSDPHHLRLDNGRVVFMNKEEKLLLPAKNQLVSVETDEKNNLVSIQSLNEPKNLDDVVEVTNEDLPFEPTVINGYGEAEKIFKRLNGKYQRVSQCFNRAHVWSNDEFKLNGIKSMKTFVFFTASYINRHRFNWWFHVAPMLHVAENGGITERVLDFRYTSAPITVREWTDMFVYTKRACLLTTKFSEYDVNPQTEDCYLMNVNMYYWQPSHIAAREKGVFQNKFSDGEVRAAYQEAF